MFQTAIPVFHVKSSRAAENFYCRHLGFQKEFEYRIDEAKADPCYMGLRREKAWIHLSSFSGDGVAGGVVFLLVDDVDVLFLEFISYNVAIELPSTMLVRGNCDMFLS